MRPASTPDLPRHPEHPAPRPRRRLSPQATLLSLGVLLLLAAGVTFLAVTWNSLPVTVQAGIIGLLALLSFAGSVPASKFKLTGTAEALAILGTGLLTVDLYGARELGLIPKHTIDAVTYAGVLIAIVAAVNLLMHRIAPKVVTYGVTAVVLGQFPLFLVLPDRLPLPALLLILLGQVVITLKWSALSTPIVRRTGAICAAVVFALILVTGSARIFFGLIATHSAGYRAWALDVFGNPHTSLTVAAATTAVSCLAALTGLYLLRGSKNEYRVPGEAICAITAGFALAIFLPQLPGPGRWLTTMLGTALAVATILHPPQRGSAARALRIATITIAIVNFLVCYFVKDLPQLGLIAALIAALAVFALWRSAIDQLAGAGIAGLSAQIALILLTVDGFLGPWTGAIGLAVISACLTGLACRFVGDELEPLLLGQAAIAVCLAEVFVFTVSPDTGTGVVLAIAAAPLVAYGMQPGRRGGLLIATALLIVATLAFVIGAGATTVEWFTVPPALLMLGAGLLRWRDRSSWIFLGPGLLLGLVPSALMADSDWIRMTLVLLAAIVVILTGVRFSLQAPFLIGAAVLAKLGIWQLLEVAPLIPRWISLATAGAILLAVGATYERRLTQAKQAARWISALR